MVRWQRRMAAGLVILCALPAAPARGDWPERVFAPYLYLGAGDQLKATICAEATGQKFYVLAFVVRGKDGKLAWDGRGPIEGFDDEITALRARGGDVMISFGGEGGAELALAERDPRALEAQYQSIIDRYRATWLDLDIEGKVLRNVEANRRRNGVMAALQKKNAGLRVSYTVAVDPKGMPKNVVAMLADAAGQGVKVYSANIMTMDYGPEISTGRKMGDLAIASAEAAHGQLQKIDAGIRIGITPLIGQNDVKSEVFTLADARAVRAFADQTPWVCSLGFWSLNRDAGPDGMKNDNTHSGIEQKAWAFTGVFKSFTSSGGSLLSAEQIQAADALAGDFRDRLQRSRYMQSGKVRDFPMPGWEGFPTARYTYSVRDKDGMVKTADVVMLNPSAEQLSRWIVQALAEVKGAYDPADGKKCFANVLGQSGGQFPVAGVVYEDIIPADGKNEIYCFRDGVTVAIEGIPHRGTEPMTPEQVEASINGKVTRVFTYARVQSTSPQQYIDAGGPADIVGKDGKPTMRWPEEIRKAYQAAWKSDRNALMVAWVKGTLKPAPATSQAVEKSK